MALIKVIRSKKRISEMIPVKEWFSTNEVCAYLDLSVGSFNKIVIEKGLTISEIGSKRYFKVAEIKNLFIDNVIVERI